MPTHLRAAHKPPSYHLRPPESTASVQYHSNRQEKPTHDTYQERDMLLLETLNVAPQNHRHMSPYIQFDYLTHAHSYLLQLLPCTRTEHPKLFGFVRPCDSVNFITRRTYLIKHAHTGILSLKRHYYTPFCPLSQCATANKRLCRVRFESVETFRRWHCHTQSATDSICRRPAPIGLVSLHFDFPFVRGNKSNRSHLCRMFGKYAIPDT